MLVSETRLSSELPRQSRSDRLLRAAITGYCSLTRPGRQDALQLQDLLLPLLDDASRETLRYCAAALSVCETAPPDLVRRLCDMSIDIAAPLIGASEALTDLDLLNIVARHGAPHARAVAGRARLHQSIRQLTEIVAARNWRPDHLPTNAPIAEPAPTAEPVAPMETVDQVETTRERLRSMMRPMRDPTSATALDTGDIYEDLLDAALRADTEQVIGSLAEALGVVAPIARNIVRDASCGTLVSALRAIGLGSEQAFLLASAIFPMRFPNAESIRSFLHLYRSATFEHVEVELTGWQEASAAATVTSQQSQ